MNNIIEEKEIVEKEFNNFSYEQERESDRKKYKQELIQEILENYKYGDIVKLNVCARFLHYNIELENELANLKHMMGPIKRYLQQRGIILRGIAGVGYYILKPKEISGYVYGSYITRSRRTLDKSEEILGVVDETQLNDIRKEELESVRELNSKLQEAIDNVKVKSRYMSRREYYNRLQD